MHIIGVPELERSSQGDDSFCAVHCVRMILRHFEFDHITFFMLGVMLRTDEIDGTSDQNILRVLRSVGLTAKLKSKMSLFDLGEALDCGALFIGFTSKGKHAIVVHGMSPKHVLVADPSYGSPVFVNKLPPKSTYAAFQADWTKAGIIVTKK